MGIMNNKHDEIILSVPDVFECDIELGIDLEANALAKCHKVINWIRINGKYPNSKSKDPVERSFGIWLLVMRRAKLGRGENIWHPRCETIAIENNMPDLFEQTDFEAQALCRVDKVIDWIILNGRYPSLKSKDIIEKGHARWLVKARQAKLGQGAGQWYPSCENLATSKGLKDLFITRNFRLISIEMCKKIIEWIKVNRRYPIASSKDIIERKYGIWVCDMRMAKLGTGKHTWYSECEILAVEQGYNDLFDQIDLKAKSLLQGEEYFNWVEIHQRYPNMCSGDDIERKYGIWASNIRRAKSGKGNGSIWYSELDDLAIKRGHPNIFNYQKPGPKKSTKDNNATSLG
jgi:hypothetical protein